eukprot:TRINITY_DN35407_c0_g1_i1.p1 TRINITY_DN35407_c0_g1~~TRINITY_DN35407_c0_g1_i1.p1  ORF type:complete len:727 (-),score=222.25 TRINITY_DN35407_c0_g1_i1:130-2310(-)
MRARPRLVFDCGPSQHDATGGGFDRQAWGEAAEAERHTKMKTKLTAKMRECLSSVLFTREALNLVTASAKEDPEYAMALVTTDVKCYPLISFQLQANRSFAIQVLQQNGLALKYMPPFKGDLECCEIAVRQNGLALQYVDLDLRLRLDLCWLAVKQNGLALQYCSETFLEYQPLVVMALRQNGLALQFADYLIKSELEVVLFATSRDFAARKFASQDMNASRDMRKIVLCHALQWAILQGNRSAMEELSRLGGSWAYNGYKGVVHLAQNNNKEMLFRLNQLQPLDKRALRLAAEAAKFESRKELAILLTNMLKDIDAGRMEVETQPMVFVTAVSMSFDDDAFYQDHVRQMEEKLKSSREDSETSSAEERRNHSSKQLGECAHMGLIMSSRAKKATKSDVASSVMAKYNSTSKKMRKQSTVMMAMESSMVSSPSSSSSKRNMRHAETLEAFRSGYDRYEVLDAHAQWVTMKNRLARHGNPMLLGLLSKAGVKWDAIDEDGRTPAHHAAMEGNIDTLRKIIATGADVNIPDYIHQHMPVHIAAAQGFNDIVALLLEQAANPNSKDAFGQTPLMHAANEGHLSSVAMLLKAGVRTNETDNAGQTAAHLAAGNGHFVTLDLLMQHDAEAREKPMPAKVAAAAERTQPLDSIKDHDGQTILDVAQTAFPNGSVSQLAMLEVFQHRLATPKNQRRVQPLIAENAQGAASTAAVNGGGLGKSQSVPALGSRKK